MSTNGVVCCVFIFFTARAAALLQSSMLHRSDQMFVVDEEFVQVTAHANFRSRAFSAACLTIQGCDP